MPPGRTGNPPPENEPKFRPAKPQDWGRSLDERNWIKIFGKDFFFAKTLELIRGDLTSSDIVGNLIFIFFFFFYVSGLLILSHCSRLFHPFPRLLRG